MKKTIRNAFAMLLALVIACGSITAFAETHGDIEWCFGDGDAWVYSYAGELTVGEKTVLPPASEETFIYLILNVEESGYYKFTVSSDIWFGIPESCTDGVYPTVTIRQIMWALKMKPLARERWETVFDRKNI